jgi:hypothetical protein
MTCCFFIYILEDRRQVSLDDLLFYFGDVRKVSLDDQLFIAEVDR